MRLLKTKEMEKLTLLHSTQASMSEKCKDLLVLWKEENNEPKWEEVIEALKKVDLKNLADKLEKALEHK